MYRSSRGVLGLLLATIVITVICIRYAYYLYQKYGRGEDDAEKPDTSLIKNILGLLVTIILIYFLGWILLKIFG
jgi:heme/copper-type cytochrome/quinol oxidase subunit 2